MNLELMKDTVSKIDDLLTMLSTFNLIVIIPLICAGAILIITMVIRFPFGKGILKVDGILVLLSVLCVLLIGSMQIKDDSSISKAVLHHGYSQKIATYEGYIDTKDIKIKEVNNAEKSEDVIYIDNQSVPKNTKDIITTKDIDFDIKKTDKVKVIAKVEHTYKKGKEKPEKNVDLEDLKSKNDLHSKKSSKYAEQLKSVKLEPVK